MQYLVPVAIHIGPNNTTISYYSIRQISITGTSNYINNNYYKIYYYI